ncbi:MAG: polysaccharide biosynthesis protein, partial [Clostridiales bacterium]|nr:polysaccharide biosynthesis protein [Clostridiales bacterium]
MEEKRQGRKEIRERRGVHVRWKLVFLDALVYFLVSVAILALYKGTEGFRLKDIFIQALTFGGICFVCRFAGRVYHQIWRYGGIQSYLRLLITDCVAFVLAYSILRFVITGIQHSAFPQFLSLFSINLLSVLCMRMV